jgi:hypothetical protein
MSEDQEALDIESDVVVEDFGTLSLIDIDDDSDGHASTSILDLPEEILLQILSHITLYELYHSVAFVCKLFCRLTRYYISGCIELN